MLGLVVFGGNPARVENSYWDNQTGPVDRLDSSGYTDEREGVPKTIAELQTPISFSSGIYAAWANLWCDLNTGEYTADASSPLAIEANRAWELGSDTQYPALRCTPGGLELQRQ